MKTTCKFYFRKNYIKVWLDGGVSGKSEKYCNSNKDELINIESKGDTLRLKAKGKNIKYKCSFQVNISVEKIIMNVFS